MKDGLGRTIDYLRLSVTDLCNLRCTYCMPPEGVPKAARGELCSLEELEEIARACVDLGVRKIRLTGGEPLTRRGLLPLVRALAALPGVEVAMTTNGQLLPQFAPALREAGLTRLNVSLDTLRPDRYRALTRGGRLEGVFAGIAAAEAAGLGPIKINAVLLPGENEDELADLADLARTRPWSVRFIERMPLGPQALGGFLPAQRVLEAVPALEPLGTDGVARLYTAPGWAGTVGLITPMSCAFCAGCSRIRVTADGRLRLCLHGTEEIPLRGLRGEELKQTIQDALARKPARHDLGAGGPSPSPRDMYEIGG